MFGLEMWTLVAVVGFVSWVLPLMLLARCSHWAHATQERLEETNRLLAQLVKAQAAAQRGPGDQ